MSGERARLFVALELPAEARDALVAWRREAAPERAALRLIAREYLHVTLCFLGWQDVGQIGRIGDACGVVEQLGAAALALSEAIWLPPRRPRVLAVRLADPDGTVGPVQASLSDALEAGGWYVPEKRPFLPHVTVARVPGGSRVHAQVVPAPPAIGFRADELTLYRSHLAHAGARYEPLRRMALGRRGG